MTSPAPSSLPTPAPETFAQWIAAQRVTAGATQDELAARINANGGNIVNGSVISHWEKGNRRPSGQNLVALCLALGVGLDRVMQILQVPTRAPGATEASPSLGGDDVGDSGAS